MLSVNYEYSRSNRENLPLTIQIKLLKKTIEFLLHFFLQFWYLYEIFNAVNRKMRLIGQEFLKLLTPKYVLI